MKLARPTDRRGFSLMELLIVLVLLGFATSIALPTVGRFMESFSFRRGTQEVLNTLRYARLQAIASRHPVLVTAAKGGEPALQLAGRTHEVRPLPFQGEARIVLEPAKLVFHPEGMATSNRITVSQGNRVRRYAIDPLTGLSVTAESP